MDFGGWLRALGLERYERVFRENEIDERVLPELTADDLKELGVAAIGHRRLLLKAIADLAAERDHIGIDWTGMNRVHPDFAAAEVDRC